VAERSSFPALDWQAVAQRRARGRIGNTIVYVPEIDSTNSYAAALLPGSAAGTVVVADYQSAGRGRLHRPWVASFGSSLTFTVIVMPLGPAWVAPMAVGVALATTLATFDIAADLKWPNDVLIDGRKCCGILIESTIAGGRPWLLLGIGLNVRDADPSLPSATYLDAHVARPVAREDVFVALLEQLEWWLDRGVHDPAQVREIWRSRLGTLGQRVAARTPSGILHGLAKDVAEDGGLVIRLDDGSARIVHAGDVTLAPAPKNS
jgi:BirA family transcriptional regulator, biotin operon repressor / biotin---[acetyl-CoA-carboxylase] ligase